MFPVKLVPAAEKLTPLAAVPYVFDNALDNVTAVKVGVADAVPVNLTSSKRMVMVPTLLKRNRKLDAAGIPVAVFNVQVFAVIVVELSVSAV